MQKQKDKNDVMERFAAGEIQVLVSTTVVEVGVDVKSLSQMLGHSNVATTLNTYVHPSMDTMRVQIEKPQTVSVN